MVEILNFSRETAFTPENIQILAAALDDAWERLRRSGSRLARPAYSRAMREVVAKRIMEMAQRGVQDREALVADALRFVAANYEQPSNGKMTRRDFRQWLQHMPSAWRFPCEFAYPAHRRARAHSTGLQLEPWRMPRASESHPYG